jgi:hypothetical protein
MLEFIREKVSDRKIRLFNCACCRRIWVRLDDKRMRQAVVVAEAYADGKVPLEALQRAHRNVGPTYYTAESESAHSAVWCASRPTVSLMAFSHAAMSLGSSMWAENNTQTGILRCIVGNPFHPPRPLSPAVLAWNDDTVRRIAEGIYEERAFDRLPILHDALLDAGCDNEDILSHCRSAGPHVRGCWVIELILGKT